MKSGQISEQSTSLENGIKTNSEIEDRLPIYKTAKKIIDEKGVAGQRISKEVLQKIPIGKMPDQIQKYEE